MKTSPLLSVKGLTIGFGNNTPVVDEVTFQLEKGKRMGLIGRSGSGKSITAHAIAGLLPSTAQLRSGKIELITGVTLDPALAGEAKFLEDQSADSYRNLRGKTIGMIFQEPQEALNPTMSCGHQFMESLQQYFPTSSKSSRKEIALEWLQKVRLPSPDRILRAYPHELSGGQQQRLLIAMVMSANPRLLIADEPTTALDTVTELEILQLLKQLTDEQGSSLLFISHDLAVVRYIAESVIVMESGKVIAAGNTNELIQHPPNPGVASLVNGSARLQFNNELSSLDRKGNSSRPDSQQTKNTQAHGILQTQNLHYNYVLQRNWLGKATNTLGALKGIDLTIDQGEFIALVGESGCGKSTLGRCLNGLLTNYEGTIRLSSQRKHAVQTVFQNPAATLNPSLTCRQTIGEVIRFHQLPGQTIDDELTAAFNAIGMPLAEFGHRYPEELSGGQKQRMAIARALAARPDVLICDEAVSALDAELQLEIMALLHKLCRETDLSILFVSHDLALVLRYADRVLVMDEGKIVEEGSPENLLKSAEHKQTKLLLRAARLEMTQRDS